MKQSQRPYPHNYQLLSFSKNSIPSKSILTIKVSANLITNSTAALTSAPEFPRFLDPYICLQAAS